LKRDEDSKGDTWQDTAGAMLDEAYPPGYAPTWEELTLACAVAQDIHKL